MEDEAPEGLFHSIKKLSATIVSVAQTRIALFSVEVEEEVERLASLFLKAVLTLFFMGLGVILLSVLLIVVYWDSNRIFVLALLAALFSLAGIVFGISFLNHAKQRSRLFETSLAEFRKDQSELS